MITSYYLDIVENIVDNVGLKVAFNTFSKWNAQQNELFSLAGLNLSQKQLFFLSFAQVSKVKILKIKITVIHLIFTY